MTERADLVRLSQYVGERFDLVQAGGGNVSLKRPDGTMIVKASGVALADVDDTAGFAEVTLGPLAAFLRGPELVGAGGQGEREQLAAQHLVRYTAPGSPRPSLETYMHTLFHRCVAHTHPLAVSAVVCRRDWRERLRPLFAETALYVDYRTPGIDLAVAIDQASGEASRFDQRRPVVVFLQNHGLLVSGDSPDEVLRTTDETASRIERHFGFDYGHYKLGNRLSRRFRELFGASLVSYLSCDVELARIVRERRSLLFTPPLSPDEQVYCGALPLEIDAPEAAEPFTEYARKHGEPPRVVLWGERLFFFAPRLRKAREMEEVFKFQLLAACAPGPALEVLSEAERRHIGSWEAERYRRER